MSQCTGRSLELVLAKGTRQQNHVSHRGLQITHLIANCNIHTVPTRNWFMDNPTLAGCPKRVPSVPPANLYFAPLSSTGSKPSDSASGTCEGRGRRTPGSQSPTGSGHVRERQKASGVKSKQNHNTCGPEGGGRKLGKETTLGLFRQQKPGRELQHAMAKGKGECQQRPPNTTPTQPTHGNTQPPQQPQQQQQQQQQPQQQ